MRICMLVKNSFEFDARVTKEARSLIAAGHDVVVVALHVPGVTEQLETRPDGIRVIRVPRIYGRLRNFLPDFLSASTTTPGGASPSSTDRLPPETAAPASTAVPSLPGPPASSSVPAPRPRESSRLPPVLRRALRPVLRRALRIAAWPLQRLNDRVVGRRMYEAAMASHPDVVHAHDLNTLAVGGRIARRSHARLVYDAHELHTARNDSTVVSRFLARWRERSGVRRADAVITATATWADMMAGAYGIERPAVVRNMPPPTVVQRPLDLRGRLGLPEDATILLYQGSIQTNRGIEQTIDALQWLPDCVLVVCGYGAHRPALEERVAATGLVSRVAFDGPVPNDELIRYSAGADMGMCLIMGASLSYRTSLPNKLFEYLMAGIPVVASDFPEMGAVVRDTDTGEVCDPADATAVAAAITRLRDPVRYQLARHNAAMAARTLHWETEQEVLLQVYERLLAAS